ncbi:acyltransferase family protein [Spirosoma pulveris]
MNISPAVLVIPSQTDFSKKISFQDTLATTSSGLLPNLNGVRFIAAFLVLLHHIEQVKWEMKVPNVYEFYLIKNSGKLGVGMFFVLSGFLITYLLLRERSANEINVSNFYARRILRIWPLYLLIVFLALLVFPNFPTLFDYRSDTTVSTSYFVPQLTLFLLILPNLAIDFFDPSYLCSPAWSIGVEEQFYILWPHIMRTKKWSRKLAAIITYILGITVVVALCVFWYKQITPPGKAKSALSIILVLMGQFRISLMLIGAMGATLLHKKHSFMTRWLFAPSVQITAYTAVLVLWLTGTQIPGCNLEIYGLFFGLFILNVAGNPKTLIRLDGGPLERLGRISYGVYLYHIPLIVLLINLLQHVLPVNSGFIYNLILYMLSICLTLIISSLSYTYSETPFLRFKDHRFAAVSFKKSDG